MGSTRLSEIAGGVGRVGQDWQLTNHFIHHGRASTQMLCHDPGRPIGQLPLDFLFDDASARSKSALMA